MINVEVDGRKVIISTPREGLEEAKETAVRWLTELQGVDVMRAAMERAEARTRNLESENVTLRQRVKDLERVIKRNEYTPPTRSRAGNGN